MRCIQAKAGFQLKAKSPICLRKMEAETARSLTGKFCNPPKSANVGKRPKIVGQKVFWVGERQILLEERQTGEKFSRNGSLWSCHLPPLISNSTFIFLNSHSQVSFPTQLSPCPLSQVCTQLVVKGLARPCLSRQVKSQDAWDVVPQLIMYQLHWLSWVRKVAPF